MHRIKAKITGLITWLVDICTRFYCPQSATSECNMKHAERNMKHSWREATIGRRCNKPAITWLFLTIWYISFSTLYIALALRASKT